MRSEQGNVSVIALSGVGLALVLCLGVARVGSAAVLQSRADNAADAAALAGADALALALGDTSRAAADAARSAASDNGALLVTCSCSGDVAEVAVEMVGAVGRAHGHARAEVDLSRVPTLAP